MDPSKAKRQKQETDHTVKNAKQATRIRPRQGSLFLRGALSCTCMCIQICVRVFQCMPVSSHFMRPSLVRSTTTVVLLPTEEQRHSKVRSIPKKGRGHYVSVATTKRETTAAKKRKKERKKEIGAQERKGKAAGCIRYSNTTCISY